jgi:hypothetical protein
LVRFGRMLQVTLVLRTRDLFVLVEEGTRSFCVLSWGKSFQVKRAQTRNFWLAPRY